jgi:hypothetical protein
MDIQQKRQSLKLPPRAESLANLRALRDRIIAAAQGYNTATTAAKAAAEVGETMPDGSIFAGFSPDTGQQMFAMPGDAGVAMTFNEATQYAQKMNAENTLGHDDWRVPSREELNALFKNRDEGALKGTVNLTGSYPLGWYWSCTPFVDRGAYSQRFSDGVQYGAMGSSTSSVRCVR